MLAGLVFVIVAVVASYHGFEYFKMKSPGYYEALERRHVTINVKRGMLELSVQSIDQRLMRWWSRQSQRAKWMYSFWYKLGSFYGPLAQVCIMAVLTVNVAVAGVRLLSFTHTDQSETFSAGASEQHAGDINRTEHLIGGEVASESMPYGAMGAGISNDVTLMLPGVTVPLGHVVYIFAVLILNGICHELGHAIAATIERVPVNACGVYVYVLYPGAFVDVAMDALGRLAPAKQQRIFSAGVFNNLGVAMATYVAAVTFVPLLLGILYSTGNGALVQSVNPHSPLLTSLIAGQHAIVRVYSPSGMCIIDTADDWTDCLAKAISHTYTHTPTHPHLSTNTSRQTDPSTNDDAHAHTTHNNANGDEEDILQPWMNHVTSADPRFPQTLPMATDSDWGYCVTDDQIRATRYLYTGDQRPVDPGSGYNITNNTKTNIALKIEQEEVIGCCGAQTQGRGDHYSFGYSPDAWSRNPTTGIPGRGEEVRNRRRAHVGTVFGADKRIISDDENTGDMFVDGTERFHEAVNAGHATPNTDDGKDRNSPTLNTDDSKDRNSPTLNTDDSKDRNSPTLNIDDSKDRNSPTHNTGDNKDRHSQVHRHAEKRTRHKGVGETSANGTVYRTISLTPPHYHNTHHTHQSVQQFNSAKTQPQQRRRDVVQGSRATEGIAIPGESPMNHGAINRTPRSINRTPDPPTCECMPARATVAGIPCQSTRACTTFDATDISAVRCMVPLRPHPTVQLFRIEVADIRSLKVHDRPHTPKIGHATTRWNGVVPYAHTSFVMYEGTAVSLLRDLTVDSHLPREVLYFGGGRLHSMAEATGIGHVVRFVPLATKTFARYMFDLSVGLSLLNAVPVPRLDGEHILRAAIPVVCGWMGVQRGGERQKALVDIAMAASTTVLALNVLIAIAGVAQTII